MDSAIILVSLILIHWIVIYPVDSAIQCLNNRGLEVNIVLPNFDLNVIEKEADEEVNYSGEEYSSQEIDNFIQSQKLKNTVKKTKLDWQRFYTCCQRKLSGSFGITNIPFPDLNENLCIFFKDLRKNDGSNYEPDLVSIFQKRIQRHIT